jgi:hypothetical protein
LRVEVRRCDLVGKYRSDVSTWKRGVEEKRE